jgi:DNA polymerase theta
LKVYLKHSKVENLFEWQKECLEKESLVEGKNLIFSAPTSAGKSLVCDLLFLRKLLLSVKEVEDKIEENKKSPLALIILPFLSLISEKEAKIKHILEDLDLNVNSVFSAASRKEIVKDDTNVVICTMERANGILNKLI